MVYWRAVGLCVWYAGCRRVRLGRALSGLKAVLSRLGDESISSVGAIGQSPRYDGEDGSRASICQWDYSLHMRFTETVVRCTYQVVPICEYHLADYRLGRALPCISRYTAAPLWERRPVRVRFGTSHCRGQGHVWTQGARRTCLCV